MNAFVRRFLSVVIVFSLVAVSLPAIVLAQGGDEEVRMGDWESPTPENLPDEIPIGVLFGLSGGVAVYGEVQQRAVQLAVDEINESGYLGDSVLVPFFEDSGGSGEQAIAAMTKVIEEDEVVAVIGPTLSSSAFSADPIAQENGIPVLGVSNTANGITDMGEFVFRDSLPEAAVIPGTIAQAAEILGLERVGVLYGNDDDFTYSGYEVFVEALEDNEIEITTEETFARGDVDFNAQLTNIIATEPDAIVVSALAQEGVPIIVQARQLGFTGPIIGGNGFNSPAIVAQAGDAANGVIVGAAWNIANQNPLSAAFIEAFEEAYDAQPDQFAAQAYTGTWLIATAIRRADSADPADIRDALAEIEDFPTPLGSFSFDEDRNPVHEPVAQIIVDGVYEILSEETAAAAYGEE